MEIRHIIKKELSRPKTFVYPEKKSVYFMMPLKVAAQAMGNNV